MFSHKQEEEQVTGIYERLRACRYKRTMFFLAYTISSGCLIAFWVFLLRASGKTFIWKYDGFTQHWNVLAYYGKYLRDIFYHLFKEHELSIPMWNMSIGAGGDILTTFHYYTIGDPLNLLSVLVPVRYTEYLYVGLVLLRCYLSGISFSVYCFYHKHRRMPVLLGSLIYIFANYQTYAAVKHPYFINPMIYLPLLLLGIDKIYKKEKPYLFMGMTAIAAVSNFYFFYMLCIFMFLYAAFRYFVVIDKKSVKNVFSWFFQFLGYFMTGVLIAMPVLFPVLATFFGSERSGVSNDIPLLYKESYYRNFLTYINSGAQEGAYWLRLGFAAFAVMAALLLISRKKKKEEKALFGGLVLLLLFCMIPAVAHVMNGFSYPANRWTWAFAMLMAYIFVVEYPVFGELEKKEKRKFAVTAVVYIVLSYAIPKERTSNVTAVLFLTIALVLIACYHTIIRSEAFWHLLVWICIMVNLTVSLYEQFAPEYLDAYRYADWGKVLQSVQSSQTENAVAGISDDSFWRYDERNPLGTRNASLHYGLNGVQCYYSLPNPVISEFFKEMWKENSMEQQFDGLDERTALELLFSVKYFGAQKDTESYVPSIFDEKAAETVDSEVYMNEDSLPLGYTYDSVITREAYEKMTALEKQQALLQGAVVEESQLPECDPVFTDQEAEYEIEFGENITASRENEWYVTKKNSVVTLTVPELGEGEAYLLLKNVHYDGITKSERYSEEEIEAMSSEEKQKMKKADQYLQSLSDSLFQVSYGSIYKSVNVRNAKDNYYCGRHDFLLNLGENRTSDGKITITLERPGKYTFDELSIVTQPLDNVVAFAADRKEDVLENAVVDGNYITGDIELDKRKLLCISVPYSRGWTAYVDGEKTEIQKVNTAFMGLELEAGHHDIRLVYRTPFIKYGILLCVAGCCIFLFMVFRDKCMKKYT